jgi:hypothetical protein
MHWQSGGVWAMPGQPPKWTRHDVLDVTGISFNTKWDWRVRVSDAPAARAGEGA